MENLLNNLKQQIIDQINLVGLTPESIDNDSPIFNEGLGLDSIDALEIVVLLEQHYGILVNNPEDLSDHFVSIRTLAEFIEKNQVSAVS
ncbi:acyl carrier protein [Marivirga sp. S37H4]|uniref:Acyl carrier protein n=2 Tax=Marivirga aurantiaca TaxID=2802615 RepID=A0A934WY42_9BACT|nr:acyl carrier protein [Marivirga aurantiaca]